MKRIGWIFLGGLLLAQPGQALQDAPASLEAEPRRAEFSDDLDAFVRQAVNAGLLEPVSAQERSGEPKSLVPKSAQPGMRISPVAPVIPGAAGLAECSGPYPLDFAEYGQLAQYSDIYDFREGSAAEGEEGVRASGAGLAKAYLALDLSSEAAMVVKGSRDPQAIALRNLALLLEGRGAAPAAYFAELARCHPQAGLWSSLSLVSTQDAAGPALLKEQITQFGELPLHLRDRVAMIAVPALEAMSERALATLLLDKFSEAEIANSAQLQFSEAVMGLSESGSGSDQRIRRFLAQSRFQEAALSALVRHDQPLNPAVRDVLLEDVVTRLRQAEQDTDVRADLRFVLDELSRNSMYEPMTRLAELPGMQSDLARDELSLQMAASLRRDLSGDDAIRNLAAIEALVNDAGLLDRAPDRAELYEMATVVAVRLGFGSLGDVLALKAQGGEEVAAHRAGLAYRQKNFPDVYELADLYRSNQRINRLAAMAAIDTQDLSKLRTFESRLKPEPETILALIEHDASAGQWLVSERLYNEALKLSGEDEQWRVDRVMRLKRVPAETAGPARMQVSSISGKLDRSRNSLEKLSAEAP